MTLNIAKLAQESARTLAQEQAEVTADHTERRVLASTAYLSAKAGVFLHHLERCSNIMLDQLFKIAQEESVTISVHEVKRRALAHRREMSRSRRKRRSERLGTLVWERIIPYVAVAVVGWLIGRWQGLPSHDQPNSPSSPTSTSKPAD